MVAYAQKNILSTSSGVANVNRGKLVLLLKTVAAIAMAREQLPMKKILIKRVCLSPVIWKWFGFLKSDKEQSHFWCKLCSEQTWHFW